MTIKSNIEKLGKKIAAQCANCGRNPEEITLIAASKYVDAGGVEEAYSAGLRHFGENKVKDALIKIEALPKDIIWHMFGHLQSNKVTKTVGAFDLIHSIDSLELAERIDRVASERNILQKILIEVNVSAEESKFGFDAIKASSNISRILQLENISLQGFMTMAPFTDDEHSIRNAFQKLKQLRDNISSKMGNELPILSMGMTNDWNIAIEEGATHLRIGSAIFKG
ncbi:YggS family pyridoxal phosphate-dependent enzyme [bacterium]|nr:YggS family pyridoxal phosphate-dependent enzyme [bacterium]